MKSCILKLLAGRDRGAQFLEFAVLLASILVLSIAGVSGVGTKTAESLCNGGASALSGKGENEVVYEDGDCVPCAQAAGNFICP